MGCVAICEEADGRRGSAIAKHLVSIIVVTSFFLSDFRHGLPLVRRLVVFRARFGNLFGRGIQNTVGPHYDFAGVLTGIRTCFYTLRTALYWTSAWILTVVLNGNERQGAARIG